MSWECPTCGSINGCLNTPTLIKPRLQGKDEKELLERIAELEAQNKRLKEILKAARIECTENHACMIKYTVDQALEDKQ